MKKLVGVSLFIGLGLATTAQAEETQRYTISRNADGYVRTDTQSGQTSICSEKGDQLICRMAADDQQAYKADIAALEAKIDSLENRISNLEKAGIPGFAPKVPVESESEFQTSLNRMEQFFRRFMGIVKEFQQIDGKTEPAPDRT